MAHRKWKETKQLPRMLPGPAVPGCCLISFHFLWAILCPQAVGNIYLLYYNIQVRENHQLFSHARWPFQFCTMTLFVALAADRCDPIEDRRFLHHRCHGLQLLAKKPPGCPKCTQTNSLSGKEKGGPDRLEGTFYIQQGESGQINTYFNQSRTLEGELSPNLATASFPLAPPQQNRTDMFQFTMGELGKIKFLEEVVCQSKILILGRTSKLSLLTY